MDSALDCIVTSAVKNLSQLLVDEVKLLSDVKDEIKSLSDELKFMDKFLKSSEGKRNNDIVKEVVNQIKEVAHQAEDVVDTYVINVNEHQSRNMLWKCFHYKDHVLMLHKMDDQIKKIKVKIDEIYKNKAKYGIGEGDFRGEGQNIVEEDAESLRKRRRDVEEEEVVGLVNDSNIVIKELKESDPCLNVVSIIGMGGLGKTTLARKIYNKDEVKEMFPCRAWGYASNDYRVRELLLSLLQCLKPSTPEYKDSSVKQLKEKVKECLTGHKYLVVIDDIWRTQVWDEVKDVFPKERNGSRILITSRMKDVASYMTTTIAYQLPFLNEEDSWQLFSKKVFQGKKCPSELEDLGRTMVENCKGLPLAIIVLAGMVAKRDKSKREWLRIKENFRWHLTLEDNKMVIGILKLSYDDLPQRLKPCFLYLGIYPEDYEIPVRELIRLWIAEGFIQPKEIGTSNAPEPEDVADYYLDELVDRSLVQVASKRSDGGVKTCRIHDLLRDLCILESKENKFMEVCTELDIDKCNHRRLSFHYKTEFSTTKYAQLHTRSLLLFGEWLQWNSKSKGWKWISKSFKLARVLDLGRVSLYLPRGDLKTFIHLRYLRIQAYHQTTGNNILASVCNLWNLETLHLVCPIDNMTFPIGIWKLKRLRHVYLKSGFLSLPPLPMSRGENSETMLNLQTLCNVLFDQLMTSMLNNDSFPNLTKLSLHYWGPHGQLQCLHRLNKLRKLKIIAISNPPLDASIFPSNLTKITLKRLWDLESRFLNTLGQLASLQILKLKVGRISGSVNCPAGEFPQLEVFHMLDVDVEGQWIIENGAMPGLRCLILDCCQYRNEKEQQQPLTDLR